MPQPQGTLEAVLAYDELVELPRDGKADPEAQAKRQIYEILRSEIFVFFV